MVPPAPKDGRVRNVPPPPLELYHGNQISVNQEEKGLAISYVKIKLTQNLAKFKTRDALPGIDFQRLLGSL